MNSKCIFTFLILIFLISNVFSQEAGSAFRHNGYDWNSWNQDEKVFFVLGFITGFEGMAFKIYQETIGNPMDENFRIFLEKFSTDLSVGQIIDKLDLFYHKVENRNQVLIFALLVVTQHR